MKWPLKLQFRDSLIDQLGEGRVKRRRNLQLYFDPTQPTMTITQAASSNSSIQEYSDNIQMPLYPSRRPVTKLNWRIIGNMFTIYNLNII